MSSWLLQVNFGSSRTCISFFVTNPGTLSFCENPFHLPTWPWAMTLCIPHMKFWDFTYQESSLPLISNISMFDSMKWPIYINGRIFIELDDHDHFLEQSKPPATQQAFSLYLWPYFHMTIGCDRGPNSETRRDFFFHELTLCSLLKPLSHEITISWIKCHASPFIIRPIWILTLWDLNYHHFGTSAVDIYHLRFFELDFAMLILCHVSLCDEQPRSFYDLAFRESSWLYPLTTPFPESTKF